ncbi:MAG: TonB-dependent receptor [Bacteroidales bacterium]|nr:TonB-dependent receptor [Bacteroidales bacterium]MBN2819383.1 TonB-dependent receptor [Bacteroidales bacterium]
MKRGLLFILFFSFYSLVFAQSRYSIGGIITDEKGEPLVGANIIIKELTIGTVSDNQGKFSIKLAKGDYHVLVSYMGYYEQSFRIKLTGDEKLTIRLRESSEIIESVEVYADAPDRNIRKLEMSTNKLEMKEIKKLPVVFGEGDIIKTLQLLPGVISAGEASGGFHVRGGNVDQNLILIDRAHVYNASHAIGFFSVFNSNVIDDVKLYKGGIAPEYGGRLSSVLDIRTIDPDIQEYHAEASVGMISSKAIIQGPILNNKISFYAAARRTYADLFLPFSKDSLAKESTLYFYDLNSKVRAILGEKDRLYLSAYYGRDVLKFGDLLKQNYGNEAYSVRWNHFFSKRFFMDNYLTCSKYIYDMGFSFEESYVNVQTDILDYTFKSIFSLNVNESNKIKAGVEAISHDFNPGHISGFDADTSFDYDIQDSFSREYGAFLQNEHTLTSGLTLAYGIRYSIFHNIGKGVTYTFDKSNPEDYIPTDTTNYTYGEVYNFLPNGFEPRLSFRYLINDNSSVKASYNRMYQYIQLASNSTSSLPLEYWFPASPNIKPQVADQVAVGYFRNFKDNMLECSIEGFYKDIQNSIDFKDHANLIFNSFYEGQLRSGDAWAYGVEFLVQKQKGTLTGWFSYTYSRVFKQIEEINGGKVYSAAHDKPHDIALVLSYDLNERLNLSGTWVYTSAPPRTMPKQRWVYGGMVAPAYGDRNSVRVFPYHRMDLAATFRLNKVERNWEHSMNLSVYNTYARHNYIMISFEQDSDDESGLSTKTVGTYLYSFVPSLSYTIKF